MENSEIAGLLREIKDTNINQHKEVIKIISSLDKTQAVMNNEVRHCIEDIEANRKDINYNRKDISKTKISIENVKKMKTKPIGPFMLILTAFNTVIALLLSARELLRQYVGV